MLTFITFIQHKVLGRTIKHKKGVNIIKIRKEEIKLSLFTDDTILYIENSKEITKTSRSIKCVQQNYRIQNKHIKIDCIKK